METGPSLSNNGGLFHPHKAIHVKFQKYKCRKFVRKSEGLGDIGELCVSRRGSGFRRVVRKLEGLGISEIVILNGTLAC